MDEPLRNLTGPETVGLVAIVVGSFSLALVIAISIIAPIWSGARKAAAEAQLKRDMIAAGYSADDIERVVRVTATNEAELELVKRALPRPPKAATPSASPASV